LSCEGVGSEGIGGVFVRAANGEATVTEEYAKMAETTADVKSMLIILIGLRRKQKEYYRKIECRKKT